MTYEEAVALLQQSKKFQAWGKLRPEDLNPKLGQAVDDKHFTPAQLAAAWAVHVKVIRNLFRDEPGVLKIGDRSPKHKRQYLTLRIPKEVAERVHKKLSA